MSATHTMEERLHAVRERIAGAAQRAGRLPEDITLVAVGKTHPPECLRQAVDCGQRVFGENRVQELLAKVPLLPSSLEWHMIGHLQSNKIRKVLPVCSLIHSVDSVELAAAIDRIASDLGLFPRILLEVNVSGGASKFGFSPEALSQAGEDFSQLQRVSIEGLMTVPPPVSDPALARPYFSTMRDLRETTTRELGFELPILSMGMTSDFEVAIEEGATHVRVGTALFGGRSYPA